MTKKNFGDQMTSFLFEHDQMTKVRILNLHCQTASHHVTYLAGADEPSEMFDPKMVFMLKCLLNQYNKRI